MSDAHRTENTKMLDQPLSNPDGITTPPLRGVGEGPLDVLYRRRRGGKATPSHRWIGASLGRLGVVLAVLALTAGCGPAKPQPNQASPSAAPATPATSVSPSPAAGAGAATALDAYRQMWKAYLAAIKIPDPAFP